MVFSKLVFLSILSSLVNAYNPNVTDIPGVYIVNAIVESTSNKFFFAEADDTSAIIVENGGSFTLDNVQVYKTGDTSDNGDSSFTGLNAAVVAQEGGKLVMHNSFIYANGKSANTVKVYQDGSSAYLHNVQIFTEGDSAHGPYIAGGYLFAKDCIVQTVPDHASGYATDRGGGTIEIRGGSVLTHGQGSPVQYSTGSITSYNLVGLVLQSPCLGMDGPNYNWANNPDFTCAPGDQAAMFMINSFGNATAAGTMGITGGSVNITTESAFIISTNAISNFYLNGVTITQTSNVFVNASAMRWGTTGYNGGHASVYLSKQKVVGDVYVDSISGAALVLTKKSFLNGALNSANTGGNATIILDSSSTWNITADSYVTKLETQASCFSNIASNGFNVYYDINQNSGFQGKTYALPDGGKLLPYGAITVSTTVLDRRMYEQKACSSFAVAPSYTAT